MQKLKYIGELLRITGFSVHYLNVNASNIFEKGQAGQLSPVFIVLRVLFTSTPLNFTVMSIHNISFKKQTALNMTTFLSTTAQTL